jgi:Flp pilus assembly protein TadB
MNVMMVLTVSLLFILSLGGVAFAFAGAGSDKARKRMAAVAKPTVAARAAKSGSDANQQRRKNVQTMLKELEKQQAQQKTRPSCDAASNRRADDYRQDLLDLLGVPGLVAGIGAFVAVHALYAMPLAGLCVCVRRPALGARFLKRAGKRRSRANLRLAIDTIVRSVKSGLPVNER